MSKFYTNQSISGYNDTPPADDGSAVAANRISWATILTKLANPLRTLLTNIATEAESGFAELEAGRSLKTIYSTAGADTHTYQSWTNKAWIIATGPGGTGTVFSGLDNGDAGGSGSTSILLINNVADIVGTATLQIGSAASASATTYADSESNAATGNAGSGLNGGAVTVAGGMTAINLPGSKGERGGGNIEAIGGSAFGKSASFTTTVEGCGGRGGLSGDPAQQGGDGEIIIIEYE